MAYVNKSNPNMNYNQPMYIGNSCEAYVNYSLNSLLNRRSELYFFVGRYTFYHRYIDELEINIILINSKWNSSEITWNNKPEHEEIIDVVNISTIRQGYFIERYNLEKAVDLTEFFNYNYPDEISLCINITLKNDLFIFLNQSCSFSPGLLWNYEKLLLSYTTITTTTLLFVILLGVIYLLKRTSIEENKKHNYRIGLSIFWIVNSIAVAPLLVGLMLIIINVFNIHVGFTVLGNMLVLGIWFGVCGFQIQKNFTKYKELRKKR
jgi:hypothetical protein